MAEVVFAAGVPHAPALVGLLDRAPDDAKRVIERTFENVARGLIGSRADVVIMFANDHLTNNRVRTYPDFLIGAAPLHRGPHEWFQPWIGCRSYELKGDPEVAKALFRGMGKRGVKMFLETRELNFDDNISVPTVRMDLDRMGIALVPVLQNCTVPPFPDQRQCYAIGKAVGDFVRDDLPAGMRVALIGSGGLSHEPGGAKYYSIDEEFDRAFLDLCVRGDHALLLKEMTIERMEAAGIGGTTELIAWFVVMGAIGECAGESFGYAGWTSFRCGAGGVIWHHEQAANRRLERSA